MDSPGSHDPACLMCSAHLSEGIQLLCSRWNPDDTMVILSGHRTAPESAFWLWNPATPRLERTVLSHADDVAALTKVIHERPPGRWRPATPEAQESLARYMLNPHTACPVRDGLLATAPLFGLNTYLVDAGTGARKHLCRNDSPPVWTYASTPGLTADRRQLFTARWHIQNHFSQMDQTHYSEVISVDLKDGKETVHARTPISDNIHQVAVMRDERHILLNEFLAEFPSEPAGLKREHYRERLETLRRIGIPRSRLALVDIQTGDCAVWTCPCPAPSHLVADPDDPSVYYLACHNMVVVSGELYLPGPGCLIKLRIRNHGLHMEGHYSHNGFYRLSTHDVMTYRGRKAIAVTVYPNLCEIIDADRFVRLASIELYPIARLTASGLTVPDHRLESAFSVCRLRSEDLLVLSGSRRIYLVDLKSDPPVVESFIYNSDPNWTVRAHMTSLE